MYIANKEVTRVCIVAHTVMGVSGEDIPSYSVMFVGMSLTEKGNYGACRTAEFTNGVLLTWQMKIE